MPLARGIAEVFEAIPERIEVSGHAPTWKVTGGSFESVLEWVQEAYDEPVVVAREDRSRWWPRVTLTVTTDPVLAADAPPLETFAAPPEPPAAPAAAPASATTDDAASADGAPGAAGAALEPEVATLVALVTDGEVAVPDLPLAVAPPADAPVDSPADAPVDPPVDPPVDDADDPEATQATPPVPAAPRHAAPAFPQQAYPVGHDPADWYDEDELPLSLEEMFAYQEHQRRLRQRVPEQRGRHA